MAAKKCPMCKGTGKTPRISFVDAKKKIAQTCDWCHGDGKLKPAPAPDPLTEAALRLAEACLALYEDDEGAATGEAYTAALDAYRKAKADAETTKAADPMKDRRPGDAE